MPRSKRSWSLLLYVVAIFLMLPFTGGALVGLAGPDRIDVLLTIAYFGAAAVAVHRVVLDTRLSDTVAFLLLAALAVVAGALSLGLSVPEERVHFLEYAVLVWLVRRALPQRWPPVRLYAVAYAIAVLVAITDETVQHFLPYRVGDLHDVLLDSGAALLALVYDEAVHGRFGWRTSPNREVQTWNVSS